MANDKSDGSGAIVDSKPYQEAKKLAADKLKSSCLNIRDIERYDIQILAPQQALKYGKYPLPAIKLNYQESKHYPNQEFYRLRYLKELVSSDPKGFSAMAKSSKTPRYVQPQNSPPRLYIPPNIAGKDASIKSLLQDFEESLIIVEGELKALCLCEHDFPALGLGGVYSFSSKKTGEALLPELDDINFSRRLVYICFDSDIDTNPDVLNAALRLSKILASKGADVRLVYLTLSLTEDQQKKKLGIDDYLYQSEYRRIRDRQRLIDEVLESAVPFADVGALVDFKSRVAFIKRANKLYDRNSNVFVSCNEAKYFYGPEKMRKLVTLANGNTRFEEVNLALEYLSWPLRDVYEDIIVYPARPGEDIEHEVYIEGKRHLNVWEGFPMKPVKGSAKPFLDHISYLLGGNEEDLRFIISWLAYPIQNPGKKNHTMVIMMSSHQGIGKSIIGVIMNEIYGAKNSCTINDAEYFEGKFTNMWADKMFVFVDEGRISKKVLPYINNVITSKTLEVNEKYQKSRVVFNFINMFMTTNMSRIVDTLSAEDRRFAIFELKVKPKPISYYKDLMNWAENDHGHEKIFNYLLNYDLTDYDPYSAAPKTQGFRNAVEAAYRPIDKLLVELMEDPLQFHPMEELPEKSREIYTSKELIILLDPEDTYRLSPLTVSNGLHRHGFVQVAGGEKLWCPVSKRRDRYWCIFKEQSDKWSRATADDCKKHLDETKFDYQPKEMY